MLLSTHMDQGDRCCYPEAGTVADALQVKKRSVQRCLERLHLLGHLKVAFKPGQSKTITRCAWKGRPWIRPLRRKQRTTPGSIKDETRHSYQYFPCLIPCLIPSRAREFAIADPLGSLGARLEACLGAAELGSGWKDGGCWTCGSARC